MCLLYSIKRLCSEAAQRYTLLLFKKDPSLIAYISQPSDKYSHINGIYITDS